MQDRKKLYATRSVVQTVAGTILDYQKLTGLDERQIPKALREPGDVIGDARTAAYLLNYPALANAPAGFLIGTQPQIGEAVGLKKRMIGDYIRAGSMDFVHQYGNVCAAPRDALADARESIARNRHNPETKRENSASTPRSADGKFGR